MKNKIWDKCVLIIPTRNRSDMLKRCLDFYSSYNEKITVVVADSSEPQIMSKNEKTIQLLSTEMNIFHEKYDQDIAFFEKVYNTVATKVEFEFIALAADDDYLSLDVGVKCLTFLEKSNENAYASGANIISTLDKVKGLEPKKTRFLYSVLSSNPIKRLEEYSVYRRHRFYGFHRRKILQSALKDTVLINNAVVDQFTESFLYLSIFLRGKGVCIQEAGYIGVMHDKNASLVYPPNKREENSEIFRARIKRCASLMEKNYKENVYDKDSLCGNVDFEKIIMGYYRKENVRGSVLYKRQLRKHKILRRALLPVRFFYFLLHSFSLRQRVIVNSPNEWFNLRMQASNSSYQRLVKRVNGVVLP